MLDFRYTSNIRDLSKFDVWLGIVVNVARVGLNSWDTELRGTLTFPKSNNIEMKLISSAHEPRYQTKSVVWTLQEIFNEYNKRGQYSSANFVTRIESVPLGLGSIKSTLMSETSGRTNTSARSSALVGEDNVAVIDAFIGGSSPTASISTNSDQLGRRGYELRLEYTPNGALFTDIGFINIIIRFLVLAANRDPKTQSTNRARAANVDEGYVIEVSSLHKEDDLSLENVIRALGTLPQVMYEQRAGGRWAELTALIKFDGMNIGKITVKKGDIEIDSNATLIDAGTTGNSTLIDFCVRSNSTARS